MKKIFLLFISLTLIFTCSCKLENETIYDLILNAKRHNAVTGPKGPIAFSTNSSSTVDIFDESDIEKQLFDSKIIIMNSSLTPQVKCSLWKPKEKNIYIICDLQQELKSGIIDIKLSEYILNYKDKKIKIFSEEYFYIDILESDVPFLYADKQIIDFNDGKESYDIKFKSKSYNEGNLFLLINQEKETFNHINLRNDCSIKEKELICKINKTHFEGHLLSEKDAFGGVSLGKEYGLIYQSLICDIIIKYKTTKETINVEIKRVINGIASQGIVAAYETDITQISQCTTKFFDLNFTLDDGSEEKVSFCFLKKYKDNNPLLLLCSLEFKNSGNFTLSEIKQEIKLEDINLKYNFVIKPVKNEEKINYSPTHEIGGVIFSIDQNILDFTKQDSYKVLFAGRFEYSKGLAIEPNLKDLDCIYKPSYIECTIPKNYFDGQKTGYYYTYQNNHLGGKSPCYEAEPFKVILSDDSKSFAENINIFGYMFTLLITFILF